MTKTRKGPITKAENLRNWEETYAGFFAACRAHFGFLVEREGFRATEEVSPAAGLMRYARDEVEVWVQIEYLEPPWVSVRVGEGGSFGLHVVLETIDPAYRATAPTGKSIEEWIAYYGRFFAGHAEAIFAYRSDAARGDL